MFDEKIETLPYQNHAVSNGNLASTNPNSAKKSKESEHCPHRSNQKKKCQTADASAVAVVANGDDNDATNDDCGDAKVNADSQQNVPERMWHELAHLIEELDEAEAEIAKISNEIELLNSTYMEDSHEQECDLELMNILGTTFVAHVGAHVGVGLSTQNHKSVSTTNTVEDIPPENLASDEDMEEEESSSCGTGSCSDDSFELGKDDDSVNLLSAANGAPSPSSPLAPIRDYGPAERPSAPIGLLKLELSVASVDRDELEFDSFPSDPMCAEVAAVVGEWEIIKNKKHHSINVK
ncbi:hypothetical protein SADUNF_Sadunf16G0021500 [Salix dunnii]|uniref:Uncharacterized protein n=1 Tax=Salix dunnii TaxID=1413687 RepID=A0A835J9E3_9ROSI|nr:hypothetical protein SADUNF_Sadunf16G0021500 [Salix dunnii]